jgi:chromate reductase
MKADRRISILGICGSIRAESSNRALLAAAAKLVAPDVSFVIYDRIGEFTLFDPGKVDSPAQAVLDFRQALASADAVVIASPEYAHGITGALKNALDWVVGSGEFSGKPVAAVNASPTSFHAHESLMEILRTMDARVIGEASLRIPLPGSRTTEEQISADPGLCVLLTEMLAALAAEIVEIQ